MQYLQYIYSKFLLVCVEKTKKQYKQGKLISRKIDESVEQALYKKRFQMTKKKKIGDKVLGIRKSNLQLTSHYIPTPMTNNNNNNKK